MIDLAAPLGVFESTTVNLGNKTYTSSVDIQISIDEIDGVADEADNLSILSANFIRPVVNKQKLIVNFTTDFYPGETSWRLRDNKNRTLITTTYNPGNEDSFGGGGEDANTTFSYDVDIENTDITCLTLTISDSFGDGMTAFNSSLPTPGVQLSLEDGTIIKPMLRSDWDFETSRPVFASADFTSSLQEASFVESLSVYPNPVGDILNVDIKIKDAMEYTLFVSDILGKHMTSMVTNAQYLDVNHLPSGIYFLNVKTEQGLYTYKFNKL